MTRILVIEDHEANRDLLARRLRRQGFEVETEADGEAGLARLRRTPPALVLLDLGLPGMDGWEVARRIRGDPATSGLPVIALTAHAMADDREKALAAGCDEYETKPVVFDRLFMKMARLLGSSPDGETGPPER